MCHETNELDMGEPSSRTFKHGDNLIKWLTSKIHFFYLNFQRNPSEYFEANILMKNIELTSNVRWVNLQVCSTFIGQHTKPVWGCLIFSFSFFISLFSFIGQHTKPVWGCFLLRRFKPLKKSKLPTPRARLLICNYTVLDALIFL